MNRISFVSAFVFMLATTVTNAGVEEGIAALQRGDYATAIRELRPLAEQGHADAQVYVGLMYGLGQGVAKDHAEAVKWFRKAADQGNATAQYGLGEIGRAHV